MLLWALAQPAAHRQNAFVRHAACSLAPDACACGGKNGSGSSIVEKHTRNQQIKQMARALAIVVLLLAAVAVVPFAQARKVEDKAKSADVPEPAAADAPAKGPDGASPAPEPSAADAPAPSADK